MNGHDPVAALPVHAARGSARRYLLYAAIATAFLLGIGGTLLFQNRARLSGFARSSAPQPVVLIGLDGADWNIIEPLIAAGRMPHMAALAARGARARLLTINPTLSPVI